MKWLQASTSIKKYVMLVSLSCNVLVLGLVTAKCQAKRPTSKIFQASQQMEALPEPARCIEAVDRAQD